MFYVSDNAPIQNWIEKRMTDQYVDLDSLSIRTFISKTNIDANTKVTQEKSFSYTNK